MSDQGEAGVTVSEDVAENGYCASSGDVIVRHLPQDQLTIVPGNEIIENNASPFSEGISPYASHSFDFSGCKYGEYWTDESVFYIEDGDSAQLYIDVCTWMPEINDIEIGIYNYTSLTSYTRRYSNGKVSGTTVNFSNLDRGDYMVIIRNASSPTIVNGYMRYSFS